MKYITELLCLAFSAGVIAEPDTVVKKKWLESIKPTEIHWHCHNAASPINSPLKGTTADCELKVEKLFDYCAGSVANVQLPEKLTTDRETNQYSVLMSRCIGAYYFGGAHLEVFNSTQKNQE